MRDLLIENAYLFVKIENLTSRANICDVQNNQKLEILEKFSKPSRYTDMNDVPLCL